MDPVKKKRIFLSWFSKTENQGNIEKRFNLAKPGPTTRSKENLGTIIEPSVLRTNDFSSKLAATLIRM